MVMSSAADLPCCPAYKPTGVGWLGDMPAHWEVRRLRNIVNSDSVKDGIARAGRDLGPHPCLGGGSRRAVGGDPGPGVKSTP